VVKSLLVRSFPEVYKHALDQTKIEFKFRIQIPNLEKENMATTTTTVDPLPAYINAIKKAKDDFRNSGDNVLKHGGTRATGTTLMSLQRFIQVLALDETKDPNKGEGKGYADDKKADARRRDLFPIYLEQAYNMANHLHFFAQQPYTKFQEQYLKILLLSLGGKDSICLASLISQSAKTGLGFKEVGPNTVLESAKKAVRSYLRLCVDFEKLLGPDGKPKSGRQWIDLLEEFLWLLYQENKQAISERSKKSKSKKKKKYDVGAKDAGSGEDSSSDEDESDSISDEEDQVPSPPALDIDDYANGSAETNNKAPLDWLPGSDYNHAWLIFVLYGPYGRNVWQSTELHSLRKSCAAELDDVKKGRNALRSSSSGSETSSAIWTQKFIEGQALSENLYREAALMHKRIHIVNEYIANLCESNQNAYDNFRTALEAQERQVADQIKETHQDTLSIESAMRTNILVLEQLPDNDKPALLDEMVLLRKQMTEIRDGRKELNNSLFKMQNENRSKLESLRKQHEALIKQEREKLNDKSSNLAMKTKITNAGARPTPSPANIQSRLTSDDISSVGE
jgi:hypothetical protein